MKINIHELALKEFYEAVEWYEYLLTGLGDRFKVTVLKQVNKIRENPQWFLKETDQIYKAYIPKFPYKILFSIEDSQIIIWAISHIHRKPSYWQKRLN